MELEFDSRLVAGRFREIVRRVRPDAAHFFHLGRLSSSPLDVCREEGVPAFLTPTDFWCVCPTCQLRLPGNAPCDGPEPAAANCVRHLASFVPSTFARIFARLPLTAARLAVRVARSMPDAHPLAGMAAVMARRAPVNVARVNRLAAVFTPTRLMAEVLGHHGVRPDLMRHCPFGIDPAGDREPRTPDPAGRLRVGYVGTLAEHKGVHVLLEAVGRLPGLAMDVRVHGSPDDFPAYASRLRAMAAGDPRISFPGTFPNREIGRIMAGFDVLVVPSVWHENTPLVIASAQAAACPVVASDVAGLAESVVHGENGILFPRGDAGALADALRRLAGDRELLGRLSAGCRPPRTIAGYVDQVEEEYRRAAATAAAPTATSTATGGP